MIGSLAAWSYNRGLPDRLVIGREALARELPRGARVRLCNVEDAAVGALEGAKADFALYIRGQSKNYMRLREQALQALDHYVTSVRKTVSDLTSSVVRNVFQTTTLLLGVIVAGLLGPAVSLAARGLAGIGYVAYVGFILLYLLPERWHRFQLEAESLRTRLAVMSELGERERSRIWESATHESEYFQTYFRRTVCIYILLCCLGIVYLLVLLAIWLGPYILRVLPHLGVA
jgi:hypothetical protein